MSDEKPKEKPLQFIHMQLEGNEVPKHVTKRLKDPRAFKDVEVIVTKKKKMRIYFEEKFQFGPRFYATGKNHIGGHDVFQTDLECHPWRGGYNCGSSSCDRCVKGGLQQFRFQRRGIAKQYDPDWSKFIHDTFVQQNKAGATTFYETPIHYNAKKYSLSQRDSHTDEHAGEPNLIVVMPEKDIKDVYIEGENLEELRPYLCASVDDAYAIKINKPHPVGCRCDECDDESSSNDDE